MHPLIHDWNQTDAPKPPTVILNDETLRDGLQSPSVRCPTIDEKLRILHLIDRLGIETADIGLPGAGPHVVRDVERLAREIADQRLTVAANCAARTAGRRHPADRGDLAARRPADRVLHVHRVEPAAAASPKAGRSISCLKLTEDAIAFAVGEGLPVMYVTEDTTRADPDTLRALYSTAIRAGAKRVCVADTVGHATPHGARGGREVRRRGGRGVRRRGRIDWHGHRDRDFAIINTLAALEAGATRLHGAAIGIGERVGNTPMELLLVNLVLMGYLERDLSALCELLRRRVGGDRRADPGELSCRGT